MLPHSPHLLGGAYLGWSLGANGAANVFGTAVATRMVRFLTAALLCGLFVVLGAVLEGRRGIETIGQLAQLGLASATYAASGAAIAMTLMTRLGIPSSTSQALVGAIIGIGITGAGLDLSGLPKVVACWIGTPIGALLIAIPLYRVLGYGLNRMRLTLFTQDVHLRWALTLAGCYGSYALGANNVANVTGVYYGSGLITAPHAALLGGLSIAVGVLTYGKRVMLSVGRSIVRLDAFSALIVVLAEAMVVHAYAWVGVPVSTSQAVVGAVIGVGLVKQATAISGRAVLRICLGWLLTPLIAAATALLLYFVTHLRFMP